MGIGEHINCEGTEPPNSCPTRKTKSAVFAVEQVADGAPTESVDFGFVRRSTESRAVGDGSQASVGFGFATGRAAIGKAGLVGPQFKFFTATTQVLIGKAIANLW